MKTKKKILHLEEIAYSKNSIQKLSNRYNVIFYEYQNEKKFEEFLDSNQFEVIFTRLGIFLGRNLIEKQKNLKIIVSPTTGYNHIDVEFAEKMGIKIIGLKGKEYFLKSVKSTAEHTWSLVLSLSRKLISAVINTKNLKKWDRRPYIADELNSKTLGIIGYGRLGKMIAVYGEAFGMKVLANDINEKVFLDKHEYVKKTSLNNLLKKSDFVLLLISWKKENVKFFDEKKIALMKKDSFFINTSRGELVDEDALLQSLISNKISGVALDVLENDSNWSNNKKISNKLLDYSINNDNVIITPHIGGYGKTSIYKTRNFVVSLFLKEKI